MTDRDHYQVLGIARTASAREIRAAYVRLSRRHHPDVAGALPSRLAAVQQAYRCLADADTRRDHDHHLISAEQQFARRQQRVLRRLHGYDQRHPRRAPDRARAWWRPLIGVTLIGAAVAWLSLHMLG